MVSRSVVEHLPDNEMFFENCARVLRPGGMLVHTFPCKFAPFSLVNQLLPNRLTRRLLAYLHPQWQDECGFVAFYDRCYHSAMRKVIQSSGFHNQRFSFRYYQSIYFDFCFPLFALVLMYDLLIWSFGIRNLACAILVTAERSPAVNTDFACSGSRQGRESPEGDAAPLIRNSSLSIALSEPAAQRTADQ